jgi:hypothetical protein
MLASTPTPHSTRSPDGALDVGRGARVAARRERVLGVVEHPDVVADGASASTNAAIGPLPATLESTCDTVDVGVDAEHVVLAHGRRRVVGVEGERARRSRYSAANASHICSGVTSPPCASVRAGSPAELDLQAPGSQLVSVFMT